MRYHIICYERYCLKRSDLEIKSILYTYMYILRTLCLSHRKPCETVAIPYQLTHLLFAMHYASLFQPVIRDTTKSSAQRAQFLILAQFLSTIVEFLRQSRHRILSGNANFAKQDCLTKTPARCLLFVVRLPVT